MLKDLTLSKSWNMLRDRLRDPLHDFSADKIRAEQNQDENDTAHADGIVYIGPDAFPDGLQMSRLVINIFLNLLLNQFRQDADIQIQALHIFVIITTDFCVRLYLQNPILQDIETP